MRPSLSCSMNLAEPKNPIFEPGNAVQLSTDIKDPKKGLSHAIIRFAKYDLVHKENYYMVVPYEFEHKNMWVRYNHYFKIMRPESGLSLLLNPTINEELLRG
jgi:hypothetical protein